ncbi:hypothetical protein CHS0354_032668 [Potamilus streckersoni]|uniref:DUF7153 domain-containing protein n=1 Tax=Potamilus streckersoni TaxID=2493646 RepID=A0AAE0TEW8_9BIVA|nr:hypothetical protein CHS0354_032668 [Potamilus streckersoni]
MLGVQIRLRFYTEEEMQKKLWQQKAKNNMKEATFLEGILLRSIESENPHPFVDYAVFCSRLGSGNAVNHVAEKNNAVVYPHQKQSTDVQTDEDDNAESLPWDIDIPIQHNSLLRKNSRQRHGSTRLTDGNFSQRNSLQVKSRQEQGLYDELEYIIRSDVKALPRTPVSKDSIYFLSAFCTDGHVDRLERTWKTWSGADFILWKCPLPLNLRRITFLKATHPSDSFTFIVLCECEEGLNHNFMAKEFLDRLKYRLCGIVGLYQVERYYIASKTKR